jgi:chemotaxis protein MotB
VWLRLEIITFKKSKIMRFRITACMVIVLAIAFTSCVSSKKYKTAKAENAALQTQLSEANAKMASDAEAANQKITGLNKQVTDLTAQNASLSKDAQAYQQMKAADRASQDALNAALKEQGTSLDEIAGKIETALNQFADAGIQVTPKEGLLFITLPEKLLFKEGSASLDSKAKNALSPLASILNDYPKVQVYVVGHTDSLKIHNAKFQDNLSLSTERANSIVRVFREAIKLIPPGY